MPRRIDTLATHAHHMEQPLSDGIVTYFAYEAAQLQESLRVDYDEIYEYMQPFGLEKSDLRHSLISFHPKRTLPDTDRTARACLYNTPSILAGSVHYPHIAIGLSVAKPNVPDINDSLRHELWHVVQDDVELAYQNSRLVRTVRSVGLAAISGAATVAGFADHAPVNYTVAAGLALAGAVTAASAGDLLAFFTPQEIEARRFAAEHQAFAPISLVS